MTHLYFPRRPPANGRKRRHRTHIHCRYISLDNGTVSMLGINHFLAHPTKLQDLLDQIQRAPAECDGQDLVRKLPAGASVSSSVQLHNVGNS